MAIGKMIQEKMAPKTVEKPLAMVDKAELPPWAGGSVWADSGEPMGVAAAAWIGTTGAGCAGVEPWFKGEFGKGSDGLGV